MKFEFPKSLISGLLAKIPAFFKRMDARIKTAQSQDEANAAVKSQYVDVPDYLDAPYFIDGPKYPKQRHSEAALEAWCMYATDGRVQAAINKLAFKATQPNSNRRPFEIEVQLDDLKAKDEVWQILHDSFKRLNIYRRARQFAVAALVEGEAFYRVILQKDQRIVGLKRIKGPRFGFEVRGPYEDENDNGFFIQIHKPSGKIVNYFKNFEVIPFYWNYDDEADCGTPLTIAAKKSFDYVVSDEDDLRLARGSRSFKRLKRKISAKNPEDFKTQVDRLEMMRRQQGRDERLSDVYYNEGGDVGTLDESSPSLWNIGDVKHHEGILFDGLQTPRALYAAGGKDVPNRSVMDVIYDEWLSSYVAAAEDMIAGDADPMGIHGEGIMKLLELHLNLQNRTSRMTPVSLVWPSKSRVTDDEVAALKNGYDTGQLSNTTYFSRLLAVDWESEQEQIFREKKVLLEQEIELAKLRKEREHLLGVNDTNGITIDDDAANDTEDTEDTVDKNATAAVESLLRHGRRNGVHKYAEDFR